MTIACSPGAIAHSVTPSARGLSRWLRVTTRRPGAGTAADSRRPAVAPVNAPARRSGRAACCAFARSWSVRELDLTVTIWSRIVAPVDDVFKALADPTRRSLLDALQREDGQSLRALEDACR